MYPMEHVPSFSLSIVFPGCVDTWIRPALVHSLLFLCGTRSMSYHSISNHPYWQAFVLFPGFRITNSAVRSASSRTRLGEWGVWGREASRPRSGIAHPERRSAHQIGNIVGFELSVTVTQLGPCGTKEPWTKRVSALVLQGNCHLCPQREHRQHRPRWPSSSPKPCTRSLPRCPASVCFPFIVSCLGDVCRAANRRCLGQQTLMCFRSWNSLKRLQMLGVQREEGCV